MVENLLKKIENENGFIAALDQSGGSTPKLLKKYGIDESEYSNEKQMYQLVHKMRTRIITSPSFNSKSILGVILFKETMENTIDGKFTADYLLEKDIVPFLKIDVGLEELENDVQLLKPIPHLDEILEKAVSYNIFGTKMRSVIKGANEKGIEKIVKEQFSLAKIIISKGLIPIIEPEIDINIADKEKAEEILKEKIVKELSDLSENDKVIFKLTLPTIDNFYKDLLTEKHTLRVLALSGGYSQSTACNLLSKNEGMIASFSRAFIEGLNISQTDEEFNMILEKNIKNIFTASIK